MNALRQIILFSVCVVAINVYSEKTPTKLSHLKKIIKKTKKEDIEKTLRKFIKSSHPSRMVGSLGHKKSVNYLANLLKGPHFKIEEFKPDMQNAIDMYQKDFKDNIVGKYSKKDAFYQKWDIFTKDMIKNLKKYQVVTGKNLIWEKKGSEKPKEILIIGAHYDTIAHQDEPKIILPDVEMPGADDNASAVILLLNMITHLKELNIPRTIRIIFFDFEELGFAGSRAYVKQHRKEFAAASNLKFAGYINLEMLGHDTKIFDIKKRFGNMNIYTRKPEQIGSDLDKKLALFLQKIGSKQESRVKFVIKANSFNSSDHISFWDTGIACVTFTQNWEDDFNSYAYHTSNDFAETVNVKTLYASFNYITSGVLAWAYNLSK